MTYTEQLKHPKWQRTRLEVLERAGFACEHCYTTDRTLHVHHGYYEKGLAPWEYSLDTLHCLCDLCHEATQEVLSTVHHLLGSFDLLHLIEIFGYLTGLSGRNTLHQTIPATKSTEFCRGLGAAYYLTMTEVFNLLSQHDTTAAELRQLLYAMEHADPHRWQEPMCPCDACQRANSPTDDEE